MASPIPNFVDKVTVVTAQWLNAVNAVLNGSVPAQGAYSATFNSGAVQLTGPNQLITSFGDFTMGLSIPAPDGSNIPTFVLGGAGKTKSQLTTDAQINGLDGLTLYIAAGSAPNAGVQAGGKLWLFGGPALAGRGGDMQIQGGTSVTGTAGDVILQGGNSTNGPAGNVYIIAGVAGSVGGNVKIYSTTFNNQSGDISFWLGSPDPPHSIPLWTMSHTGALFPGNQGAGNVGDCLVSAGNNASPSWKQPGILANWPLSLSGATATIPSLSFRTSLISNVVTISTDVALSAQTTGPDDIILSGLPSYLWPGVTKVVPCAALINGSATGYFGVATITTTGAIIISLSIPTNAGTSLGAIPNNWSVSPGTSKGVAAGFTIFYTV